MFFPDFSSICGGHITEGSGLITSPVLSSSKGSGPVSCFWVIEGSDREEIEFEIKYLEIKKTAPCTDYLQVQITCYKTAGPCFIILY